MHQKSYWLVDEWTTCMQRNIIKGEIKYKSAVHVLLSRFYPDFIQILLQFHSDFIQILLRFFFWFFSNFFQTWFIWSRWNLDKIRIKSAYDLDKRTWTGLKGWYLLQKISVKTMYVYFCTYSCGLHLWFSHQYDFKFFSGMKIVLWSESEITYLICIRNEICNTNFCVTSILFYYLWYYVDLD